MERHEHTHTAVTVRCDSIVLPSVTSLCRLACSSLLNTGGGFKTLSSVSNPASDKEGGMYCRRREREREEVWPTHGQWMRKSFPQYTVSFTGWLTSEDQGRESVRVCVCVSVSVNLLTHAPHTQTHLGLPISRLLRILSLFFQDGWSRTS